MAYLQKTYAKHQREDGLRSHREIMDSTVIADVFLLANARPVDIYPLIYIEEGVQVSPNF